MSNPALDELVKKSTELLSKLVKKTPVTAKLLSKPPFRYLHDLLTEISKTHKLAAGLFSATEMVAENVKDKAAKVAYLQKWIDCTEFATNLKVRLNPLKLVAGLEPEETNAFLQLVAKMALKKVNTAPAVDKVLHGLKFNEKAPDTAAEEKQLNEAIEPSETNPQELPETNEPSIVSIKQKVEQELHITQETTSIAQPRSRNPSNQPRIDKSKPTNDDESSNKMKLSPEYPSDKDAQDDESGLQIPVESSSLQNSTSQSTISAPSSGRRARPVSARPPPPKVRSVNITQDQISKAAPVIIREGAEAEDDEFLVQMADENLKLPNTGFPLETSDKHGGLVQKILQTKKDLQGEQVVDAIATKEGTKRTGVADIEGLRDAIQALCKSTNPLGKTMDYMQEDVDSMNKELASWKTETTKVLELKLEQERLAKETLNPLEISLKDIEESIQDHMEKISIKKADILQNDLVIQKLLQNICKV